MKKGLKIIIISIFVATLLLGAGWFTKRQLDANAKAGLNTGQQGDKISAKTAEALTKESLASQSIMLSGIVEANNKQSVKIDNTKGTVTELAVNEGDSVTKGQVLFKYINSQEEQALKESELSVQSSQQRITLASNQSSIKWDLYQKKVDTINTKKNEYNKNNDEALKGEIETLEMEVSQLYSDALTADNDVKLAQLDLEKDQLAYELQQEKQEEFLVKSEVDGIVTSVDHSLLDKSSEERAKANFIEIIDKSSLYVKGEVNEFNKASITLGQTVQIMDRQDSSKTWEGEISRVAHLASEKNQSDDSETVENPNLTKYPYTALINNQDDMPIIGAHVYVLIQPKPAAEGSIVISGEYLMEKDGKNYVWKVVGGKVKIHEVTATKRNDNLFEIITGLSGNDSIALPIDGLEEGMEVGELVKTK